MIIAVIYEIPGFQGFYAMWIREASRKSENGSIIIVGPVFLLVTTRETSGNQNAGPLQMQMDSGKLCQCQWRIFRSVIDEIVMVAPLRISHVIP
jgi:hypothetical protein